MEEKNNSAVFDNEDIQQPQQEQQSAQSGEQQEPTPIISDEEKIRELERIYQRRLQELAQKERELEPLKQLQDYLSQSPDKAEKIAKILMGEDEQTSSSVSVEPEDEVEKLKKELESLKRKLEEKEASSELNKEKELVSRKIEEYQRQYEFFDTDKFIAHLLSYPDGYLDNLTETEYIKLLDNTAKMINDMNKKQFESKFNEYLSKKKEVAEKTKSETASSQTATLKPPQEKITMDNAYTVAKKLLEKFLK